MSNEWLPETEGQFVPWWGGIARRLLQFGKLPRHVAFILDGNRRYAKTHKMESVINGHIAGFDRITKVLDWCREFGIKEVTLYAFSIENFKRTEDEVGGLMRLAKEKFEKLLQKREKLAEKKICFRFFGNRRLLPLDLQKLMAEIEEVTKDYDNGYVNVCLAYTSREEMASAMNYIREGVQKGLITEDDINEKLFSSCLYTGKSYPIDMLIRTSGEHRLSDFLLYQCSNSFIHFEDVLWPEFDFWHLLKALYAYQKNVSKIAEIDKQLEESQENNILGPKALEFLQWLDKEKSNQRHFLLKNQN